MSEAKQVVTIEELSPVRKKLSFEVPWEETKKTLDEVYRQIGRTAKVRGFRQGRIPRPLLEKYYKEYAEEEAANKIFNRFFWEALKDNNIELVSRPEIDQQGIATDKSFAFSATVEVEPAFDPEGYVGLEVEREEVEVTEADMNAKLSELQEMYSTMEEVTGDVAAAGGNHVVIDFQGSLEGEALKELHADDYLLELGSHTFIPGFEEQVIGMKKDEQKEIEVKFPDDYHHKAVAGKDVRFHVRLKSIKEKKLPEINEDFVKNFEQYTTLEELKANIHKMIEAQLTAKADGKMKVAMMDRLLEKNSFPAPDALVERQIISMMADTQWRMSMQGVDPEKAGKLLPQYHDLYKNEAVRVVRILLLMKKIAAKENIVVTPEEIASHIQELAAERGQSYEAYRAGLEKEDMLDDISAELKNKKVMELIEAQAVIRPVKRTPAAAEEEK